MAHTRTVEAIERLISAGPEEKERAERELVVARQAMGILEKFAEKETPAAPDVHVYVPEREITIESPDIHVEVAAPELPVIPPPNIEVHVPKQEPPHVTVAAPEVRVEVPEPKPRSVRVEEDPDTGERRYVQE